MELPAEAFFPGIESLVVQPILRPSPKKLNPAANSFFSPFY